jgi:hypothetical protein
MRISNDEPLTGPDPAKNTLGTSTPPRGVLMLSRRQFTGLAAGAVAGSFLTTTTPSVATGDHDPVRFTSAYLSCPPDPGRSRVHRC